jgi:hypothetical protein
MATLPAAASPPRPAADDRATRLLRRASRPAVAVAAIVAAAVALYLRPVFDLGFYYDDWDVLASLGKAPGGGWPDRFEACRQVDQAGRFGGCLYHTTANFLLGEHHAAYHVLSIVLLAACAVGLFALLRACRLGHWPALVAALLFVAYPGSDATRLWPGGLVSQYVLALYLAAVLLAIGALRRTGARAFAWHAASVAVFVLALFTYEIVVPPIAVAGIFYLLALPRRRRAAIALGIANVALALAFTAYRLTINPVEASSGFVEHRSLAQLVDRVGVVLKGAWASWQPLFAPGTAAAVVALVAACVWLTAAADDRGVRRASARWLVAVAGAGVFAVASVLAYLLANDLYVPDAASLFNRLNLLAAPAYCVAFVALGGLLCAALSHWLPRAGAVAVVVVLAAPVAAGLVDRERRSQDVWAASWDEQTRALDKLRVAAAKLEPDASVMSFGHPMWERDFIPVFAASWDLRGAIAVTTRVDPPSALPFGDFASCGAGGVIVGGTRFAAYRGPSPLWFVNLSDGRARRVSSTAQCAAVVAAWGRPPFFGSTVTGG